MRKFNGLRPQDVVLLLKLVANPQRAWLGKDLAQALHLSASEVSEALARCRFSRLLAADPRALVVQRHALIDFLFMLAFAMMAAIRHRANQAPPPKRVRTPRRRL